MSDKLLHLLHKHDRYKSSKPTMSRTVSDVFPIDSARLFKPQKVETIVRQILDHEEDEFANYNAEQCMQMCKDVAAEVRERVVKELHFERYKIVVVVQIFEKRKQSIKSDFRMLADVERDRYCIVTKENNYSYTVVCVYGLYHP